MQRDFHHGLLEGQHVSTKPIKPRVTPYGSDRPRLRHNLLIAAVLGASYLPAAAAHLPPVPDHALEIAVGSAVRLAAARVLLHD
jgi:hypothetical protein